jgi:hypothetical protein
LIIGYMGYEECAYGIFVDGRQFGITLLRGNVFMGK